MFDEYVRADARIDPAGEDLPAQRFKEMTERVIEIHAMRENERRRSKRLRDRKEQRDIEAEELVQADQPELSPVPSVQIDSDTRIKPPNNSGRKEITLADMMFE
jgi:hypothetical protein